MIAGNINRFAIQWDYVKDSGKQLLFGKVCYWLGDVRVGDYDLGVTLSDVLVCLCHQIGDSGNRGSAAICSLEAGDAYSLLYRGLFESDESLSRTANEEQWARFDISLPVDVFDDWRIYLIDCKNHSRVLLGRWEHASKSYLFFKEQQLATGEFDGVLAEFVNAVREIETSSK